jgi:hypothetical protein
VCVCVCVYIYIYICIVCIYMTRTIGMDLICGQFSNN